MKVRTTRATTHQVTLEPDEWFTILIADDKVVSVDEVQASQATDNGEWDLTLRGNRVLKSGAFGQRARVTTWEHTRAFNDAARRALWVKLPATMQAQLVTLGVTV